MTDKERMYANPLEWKLMVAKSTGHTKVTYDELNGLVETINRQQAEISEYKDKCEKCGAKTRGCIESLQNNIAEKQAEIENITEKFNCQQTVYADLSKIINDKNAEIESLERRLHNSQLHQKETHKALQDERALRLNENFIKAEAIKEFAEKIKANKAVHYCKCGETFDYLEPLNTFIDNLVKEMVGEQG